MTRKYDILVVEDEKTIRSALVDFLEYHGLEAQAAVDGLEAEKAVRNRRFDLILLDLMLPGKSGEELCRQWRKEGLSTPIIMLTARGQETERIAGLELGADDYITKPFSLEELFARIRAVLRRLDPQRCVGQSFMFGDVEVDCEKLLVKRNGQEQRITMREAAIIRYFAANPGRIVSREELYASVWGDNLSDLETRTLDVHIIKLRNKIECQASSPRIIVTVRGAGYRYIQAGQVQADEICIKD